MNAVALNLVIAAIWLLLSKEPSTAVFVIGYLLGYGLIALFRSLVPGGPAYILQAEGECAPCFFHSGLKENEQFPDDRPCTLAKFCTVLASISPREIADMVKLALNPSQPAPSSSPALSS